MIESLKLVSKAAQILIQDILTRHHATGESVSVLIAQMARKRGLGPKERRFVSDQVFLKLRQKPWPDWFNQRLKKQYGSGAKALEQALRTRAKPVLAVDITQVTLETVETALKEQDIDCARSELSKTALLLSSDRLSSGVLKSCWWMDAGSQYVAQQIKAKPGERVLDLCAGAGGKTRLIAATGADITAVDVNSKRLKLSCQQRLASSSMSRFILDASLHWHDNANPGKISYQVADGRTLKLPLFDWILVDAPCSGTGTLRHAPDLFGRLQESDLKNYTKLQHELLSNASKLLKPAGKLIYATCSLLQEENISEFDGLKLIKSRQLLPSKENCDGFWVAVFEHE